MSTPPLRLCLVDMNNGVANEATRCFRRIFDQFAQRVRAVNPSLDITFKHVQPRNLGELPDRNVDLVMSSGGPGSPHDGYDQPWCDGYRAFLDHVVERNYTDPTNAPWMFVVCHSFEVTTLHFGIAQMAKRPSTKFGIMPCYATDVGQKHIAFSPFGDRLFTWEHRNWEAVEADEQKLRRMGGAVLARESRAGRVDKGRAVLGVEFAPGLTGTQFHPEADRPGVMAWINRPEHAADLKDAYGSDLYEKMVKTLADPMRLARTFALLLPGWLTHRFNHIAKVRDLKPIAQPELDMSQFETDRQDKSSLVRAAGSPA